MLFAAGLAAAQPPAEQTQGAAVADVFPDELGPGRVRRLYLDKRGAPVAASCSKDNSLYVLSGFTPALNSSDVWVDSAPVLGAAAGAAAEWRAAQPRVPKLLPRLGRVDPPVFSVDGRNTIAIRELAPFSKDTALAMNMIVDEIKGRIIEFDIALNAALPWGVASSSGVFDVQNALTHALGHVFGLDDAAEPRACALTMAPSLSPGETAKRRLGTGDARGVRKAFR